MKLIAAVMTVAIISGVNGRKSSKASTKSAKSKSTKSKSSKAPTKSGKADLSMSTSTGRCQPCSAGLPVYGVDCVTDIGFCTITGAPPNVTQCAANNCTPTSDWLEPTCEPCSLGALLGVNCPQQEGGPNCLFTFSADAAPTCIISPDCVSDNIGDADSCGPCSMAPDSFGCPSNTEGYCQINFPADGIECVQCNATACPSFTFDQCAEPPASENGVRGLENNKGWNFNSVFQW